MASIKLPSINYGTGRKQQIVVTAQLEDCIKPLLQAMLQFSSFHSPSFRPSLIDNLIVQTCIRPPCLLEPRLTKSLILSKAYTTLFPKKELKYIYGLRIGQEYRTGPKGYYQNPKDRAGPKGLVVQAGSSPYIPTSL